MRIAASDLVNHQFRCLQEMADVLCDRRITFNVTGIIIRLKDHNATVTPADILSQIDYPAEVLVLHMVLAA
jgi:hypothetical protein